MLRRTAAVCLRISYPATSAVPDVGVSSVVSILMVVLLPAPLGPSRPNTSPCSTLKLISFTAGWSPKCLPKLRTSIIAVMVLFFLALPDYLYPHRYAPGALACPRLLEH